MDIDTIRHRLGIGPIARRIQLVVGRGILRLIDDAAAVQRAQVEFLAGEVRDGIERFQQYGFSSAPLAGMEVIALFAGGDRSQGVIVAVGDRRFRLKGMKDGEVALYDDQGQSVHLTRDGIIVKGAGKPVTITDTPKLRVEADFEATGTIRDLCDAEGRTMDDMRAIYDRHTHGGVQPGGGATDIPAEAMRPAEVM